MCLDMSLRASGARALLHNFEVAGASFAALPARPARSARSRDGAPCSPRVCAHLGDLAAGCASCTCRPVMRRLWIGLAAVVLLSFGVLCWVGSRIYQLAPPIP